MMDEVPQCIACMMDEVPQCIGSPPQKSESAEAESIVHADHLIGQRGGAVAEFLRLV